MERENFIKNLIEIMRGIYDDYRESKLPRFIKKRIYENRRKKVYSIVDTIASRNRLSVNILIEYIQSIFLEFPPFGSFHHTKAIKMNKNEDEQFTATIEIPMTQTNCNYMITSYLYYNKENNDIMIIYHCNDIDKKKAIFSFTDSHIRGFMEANPDVSFRTNEFDVSIEGDIIRNRFIETMVADIESYLKYKIDFFDGRKDM